MESEQTQDNIEEIKVAIKSMLLKKGIKAKAGVIRSRSDGRFKKKLDGSWKKVVDDKYMWRTIGDKKVRQRHRKLNKRIFSWDKPPITSDDGRRNHPGEDYNCRCVALTVPKKSKEKSVKKVSIRKVKKIVNKVVDKIMNQAKKNK